MKLFSYYALHTFKNQLKKLFKTWVLIFFAVCLVVGIGIGGLSAFLGDSSEDSPGDEITEPDGPTFTESTGVEVSDVIELAAGGVVLLMLVFFAMSADKNGSRIFQPADVNLLFPSPMKPQSVLMFRLATQLGLALLGCLYMLFQVPNLMNAGLTLWAALALVLAWGLTAAFGTLIQVLLYILASTHPGVKRFLRPAIYTLLLLIAGGYLIFAASSGGSYLRSAVLFFNAPVTRFIPIWGWIKGLCAFAMAGNATAAALCLLFLCAAGALLVYIIWNLKADFYEDAMAKSQETAELLERAQSEKSTGFLVKRNKDRSEKLRRDGMDRGRGANVFFHKSLYNRFRFAHLGFFTKTMETYIAASLAVALICRFLTHTDGLMPIALTLAALAFFRSLGNPLEQDTATDYFLLIPESTWAKLFWSLMGGTVNCLLDVLPAMLVGAIISGGNILTAILLVPLIVSVDFYATTVGTFISLSAPVSAGKTLKQVIQIMFVYFGLLPDIIAVVVGYATGHPVVGVTVAAIVNFGLGFVFFGLSPIFIDPKGGKRMEPRDFTGDIKEARRRFSTLGLGLFAIIVIASPLQIAAAALTDRIYPDGGTPSWLLWLCTFAPMYLIAIPAGLLIMGRVPSSPRDRHSMSPGHFAVVAVISVFAMYAGNIIGNVVLMLISSITGSTPANPLLTYAMDDSAFLRLLVMVMIAPMIEEFVFRKTLIDKMSVYGEKLAVVASALIFGLFHGNLSQFFYAAALGLVFGYIYLKTGKLRYTVSLHMGINFLGGVVAPALLRRIDLDAIGDTDILDLAALKEFLLTLAPLAVYSLAMVVLSITGLVFLCANAKKITFHPTPLELTRGLKIKTALLNPGMLLFTLSTLTLVALTFI